MGDKTRKLKEEMILVYGLKCWINELWIPTKKDVITFHHILERRNGGKAEWDNGALISHFAHQYLNYLDNEQHKLYKELNGMFYDLNRTYKPPTPEYYEEVNRVLVRSRKHEKSNSFKK